MKLNKKLISLSLILLLLCWTGNIIYYNSHLLKKPLFLNHYYVIPRGMTQFRLFYVDNMDTTDKITYIKFPEVSEELFLNFNESHGNSDYPYKISLITVFYNGTLPDSFYGKMITKIHFQMESGKSFDEDIGEIYVEKNDIEGDSKVLQQNSSSNSSEGTGYSDFKVVKKVKILGFESIFYDELKDRLSARINGKEISNITFPVELSKYDSFNFSYSLKNKKTNDVYAFPVNIILEDEKSKKGSSECFVIYESWTYDIDALKNFKGR